jgi:hypothetical protein
MNVRLRIRSLKDFTGTLDLLLLSRTYLVTPNRKILYLSEKREVDSFVHIDGTCVLDLATENLHERLHRLLRDGVAADVQFSDNGLLSQA